MDAATASAIAALVVAVAAFFVAILQALQQYLYTGALIRTCDSVVFAGLPGQGKRVWELAQFRFRVIYSIPQISLPAFFWPQSSPFSPSFSEGSKLLLSKGPISGPERPQSSYERARYQPGENTKPLPTKSKTKTIVGEASWVSFCRAITYSCHSSVVYKMAVQDADRCPADLPSVPMMVSMRDIVVMALMAGLECTHASFEDKSLSMQGSAGSITSSQHPILGPILHFSARNVDVPHGMSVQGRILGPWLCRLWGTVDVARTGYNSVDMRQEERAHRKRFRTASTKTGPVHLDRIAEEDWYAPEVSGQDGQEKNFKAASSIPRSFHDGDWSLDFAPASPTKEKDFSIGSPRDKPSDPSVTTRRATMRSLLAAHAQKVDAIYQDKRTVTSAVAHGHQRPMRRSAPLLLMWTTDYPDDDPVPQGRSKPYTKRFLAVKNATASSSAPAVQEEDEDEEETPDKAVPDTTSIVSLSEETADEKNAREREDERRLTRKQRDAAREKRRMKQAHDVATYGKLNYYWLSQIDVLPGIWATPWQSKFDFPAVRGAVTVILEALLAYLDEDGLTYSVEPYLDVEQGDGALNQWIYDGGVTFPAYALEAKGGVVPTGVYKAVKSDSFTSAIPALDLLFSYEYQVDRHPDRGVAESRRRLIELMRIDGWLSLVGRLDEIAHSPNDLLQQTSVLVDMLMDEFIVDFNHIDRSAHNGGLQDIQALAENVMDFFVDEELTPAEQCYVLVACLRAVKVAMSVLLGADTSMLREVLVKDVQAHLV